MHFTSPISSPQKEQESSVTSVNKEENRLNLSLDSDLENYPEDDVFESKTNAHQQKEKVIRKPRVVVKLDAEKYFFQKKKLKTL